MFFPASMLLLLLVALLATAPGFHHYVWFRKQGYALAISGMSLVTLLLYHSRLTSGTTFLCLLLILYGLRLFGFLQYRSLRVPSYRKSMAGEVMHGSLIPLSRKVRLWVFMSLLCLAMVSPVFYRLYNDVGSDIFSSLGNLIMLFGLLLESAADYLKQVAKKRNPNRVVTSGLFSFVRFPNYLGDMIFWTGVFITSLQGVRGLQWIIAFLGYAAMVFLTFGMTRRLELRQNRRYGQEPLYQRYVKRVPILLPGLPLYSLEKYPWLKG